MREVRRLSVSSTTSPTLFTHSTAVFACLSKACAPPPVGKGGSLKGPSAASRPAKDEAMMKLHGTLTREGREDKVTASSMKVEANSRVSERMMQDKKLGQWVQDNKDKPCTTLVAMMLAHSLSSHTPDGKERLTTLAGVARSAGIDTWGRMLETMLAESFVDSGAYVVTAIMESLTLSQCLQAISRTPSDTPSVERMSSMVAVNVTRYLIDAWANDSMSLMATQFSAGRVHDIPAAQKALIKFAGRGRMRRANAELLDIYTRAEYEVTQEFLKENGIESLVVSRGVRLKKDSVDFKQDDVVDIQMNPLSSWSYLMPWAAKFAQAHNSSEKGVVLHAVVPASAVQSTAFTGRGCLGEHEVILVGHAGQATVGLIFE